MKTTVKGSDGGTTTRERERETHNQFLVAFPILFPFSFLSSLAGYYSKNTPFKALLARSTRMEGKLVNPIIKSHNHFPTLYLNH